MSKRQLLVAYQVQNRDLHHTLIEVCSTVLHHLDRNDLLRLEVLTFDDLAKGTLTQNIEDEVAILVVGVVTAEDIIDVQDVIAVLVVIAVILRTLGGLCEDSAWVSRTLILEVGIADSVCCWQLCRQGVQRRDETSLGVGSAERRLAIDSGLQVGDVIAFGEDGNRTAGGWLGLGWRRQTGRLRTALIEW